MTDDHTCEEQLMHTQEQLKEYTDTLKRLQAEFENYKKRIAKEQSEFKECAIQQFIKQVLPLLDSFEQALKNTNNHEHFVKGMELLYAQFITLLQQEGLRPIEALHKQFDPYKHEVLLQEQSQEQDGTILEEFQKGYFFKEHVLRTTKVKVSRNAQGEKEIDEEQQ